MDSNGTDERSLLGCLNSYKDEWRRHRETEYDKNGEKISPFTLVIIMFATLVLIELILTEF